MRNMDQVVDAVSTALPASTSQVLLVEDDQNVQTLVQRVLSDNGMDVHIAATGAEALEASRKNGFELAIIDLGLPDIDGMILVRQFSELNAIPVLVLSGLGETAQRIRGLEAGADDYVTKPFVPEELAARVEAVLRARRQAGRQKTYKSGKLKIDNWLVDLRRHTLTHHSGRVIPLSNAEFKLLEALMDHPNKVLSRLDILNTTHAEASATERSVDIQVTRLRKKLEINPGEPQLIKTVRRLGYMLVADQIEPVTSNQAVES